MSTNDQLLQVFESCIERVGDEFHSMGTHRFWTKSDLTQRLVGCYWSESGLLSKMEKKNDNNAVPLVHADCVGLDICLFNAGQSAGAEAGKVGTPAGLRVEYLTGDGNWWQL